MSDELPVPKQNEMSLEARFAKRPHAYARLRQIADMMDQAIAQGCTADEAEAQAVEQLRHWGQELQSDWAQEKQQPSLAAARLEHPRDSQHVKKVRWFTTFGVVEICEQLLRLSRRGAQLRPFCLAAGVRHQGYSRPLQRVLADFGAEASFQAATLRVKEHYGVRVPISALPQQTLRHGRAITTLADSQKTKAAAQLITEMDGSLIPVMEPGGGTDRRQGKRLFWREVKLCCARAAGSVQTRYGATLGNATTAGSASPSTMTKALQLDLKKLQARAFDRAEWAGEVLQRYHSAIQNLDDVTAQQLCDLYHWMFVPPTLWPFNIQDVLVDCLAALEKGKRLNSRHPLLIELLPEPPDETICAAVAGGREAPMIQLRSSDS